MRRLAVTLAVSAAALSACTQSVGEAIGELTRGPVASPTPAPAPTPAPQRQAATPVPAATPSPAPATTAGAPQPTGPAAPPREEGGGLRLPRIPGLPRREASTPAPKPTPQPQVATTPPPSGGGGFLGLGALFGPPPSQTEYVTPNDKTPYRQVTLEGLARGVKDNSLPVNLPVEVTANVDARFNRQIVIDLRGGGALAVSRREGDCIQVLLPYSLDQNKFGTGRYLVKGIYRRQWMPSDGFIYEQNRYEPSCGDAYLFVRSIVKAP